ncbi:MAG: ATP-binding protein [bacterium]|nr:ATP-binding protein [bacterium]
MHWLQALDEARQRGVHAFLFTGGIGDGFPIHAGDQPVDALAAFEEVLFAHLTADDDSVLCWVYDAARGFTFPHDVHEERFRALLDASGGGASPANDATAAAERVAADAAALPRSPLSATLAMRDVFVSAARSDAPKRCIALLPALDVVLPAESGAAALPERRAAALALLQLLSMDRFRRAGHLIACAAPTAASVDELLRRPDGPLTTIAIGRPTEEERCAFVRRCCGGVVDLRTAVHTAAEALAALEEAERERVFVTLDPLYDARRAHDAVRERTLADDRTYRKAVTARERATLERDEAERKQNAVAHQRRHTLDAAIATIERTLTAPDIACVPMSATVWKQLGVGDGVRVEFVEASGVFHVYTFVVAQRERSGVYRFTLPGGASELSAMLYTHQNGFIVSTDLYDASPLPLPDGLRAVLRVPKRRFALEDELRSLTEQRSACTDEADVVPRAVRKAQEAYRKATDAVQHAHGHALVRWERERDRIAQQIAPLAARAEHPDTPEIRAARATHEQANAALAAAESGGQLSTPKMGISAFVRHTQGMSYRDIAALLRDPTLDAATIAERRVALLHRAYGHLLTIVEPRYGFAGLAGLGHVKRVLIAARDAMRSGDVKAVPQGVLLMGPPGTGKTAIAEAFARECDMLLVKFRNLRSMFVGNSEQRVEEVCQALLDLAPCIVFRDETDQEDSGRDMPQGDTGVSNRIRQRLMEFEADERIRGCVLFVKATNRPDLMDPAMKRDGRADERIVVITGDAEYSGLFPVYVAREQFPCTVADFTPFVAQVRARGFSGAGILNCCRRAYQFGGGTITTQSLADAIADAVPSADRLQDAKMTLAAVAAANSRRSLPDDIERIIADARAVLQPETLPSVVNLRELQEIAAIVDATEGQKN